MNKDLLIRGAEALEADAANTAGVSFNLGTWVQEWDAELETAFNFKSIPKSIPVSCGTSACAMGLFAIAGTFKDEGLRYRAHELELYGTGTKYVTVEVTLERDGYPTEGYTAAKHLFGISQREAEVLFSPDYYDETLGAEAELEVAKRMRELAAGEDILLEYSDYENDWDSDDAFGDIED